MRDRARGAYAKLRRTPILGVAVSRLVWAVKALLGKPVVVAFAAPVPPSPCRPPRPAPLDIRLRVALEAVEALQARVTALEAPAPSPSQQAPTPEAAPAGAPSTWSVVIPTLDRAAWLDRVLCALAYQRHGAFEVLVVRGPCRDDTDAVLARHASRVHVLACPQANISAARNLGLRVARGEAVAFLDDDAVPEPDWLERLGEGLADPRVGGVGGFIRAADGLAFQCRTVVADRFGASRDMGGRAGRLELPGPGVERYLSLTGANCGFRREALLRIGGFDETYAYFLDETDVCLRLVEAGWRLASVPAAEVHHGYAESGQRDAAGAPRRLFDCARSTAYFALRHGASRHGVVEAASRLDAYAAGLVRDALWREDHGGVVASVTDRLLAEIDAGVSQGVRDALGSPSRRLQDLGASLRPRATTALAAPVIRRESERLHLALICRDYPGDDDPARPPGGIAIWSRTLAEALARRGHEVSVLCDAPGGVASVAFQVVGEGGLWLHRVPADGARGRDPVLAGAPASLAGPTQALAREGLRVHPRRRFDLAIGPLWDLQAAALLRSAPFPVAVSLHTACAQLAIDRPDWSPAYRRSHVDKVVAAERQLLQTAPHLLANSAIALADLATDFGLPEMTRRAEVVSHGLPDLAAGVTPSARGAGVEFLFVGRLERRKGIDLVLQAAPWVLAAAPDARLTIVGEPTPGLDEGATAEVFRRRHLGAPWLARVDFAGPLPRAELLARYAACDVVLAPSRYESFGLVALEAMIFAKPCIVGDAGGLRELVVEGETGLRVPPGDAAALARAMLNLANDPGRRAALGRAGRRRYETLYSDTRMAEAFEAWAWRVARRDRMLLAAE